ncbi:MAG: hypothetical protein HY465_05530 [Deltaproteobacteria bacterium]|nr:hypothetical protein [Deltaproteobacteria bacterium]
MAIDPIRVQTQTKEMGKELDRLQVIDALRHGDINQVLRNLPNNVSREDILTFLRDQWRTLISEHIQEGAPYAAFGDKEAPSEVSPGLFSQHDSNAELSQEERAMVVESFSRTLGKAMVGGKQAAPDAGDGDAAPTPEELASMAEGTLEDFDAFMNEAGWAILDAQMIADYQNKMGEVQRDVQRVIALVKQGIVDPEYVLLALAKVNQTKNGILFTWLGKKSFMVNEHLSQVSRDLQMAGSTDFAAMERAREQSRAGAQQLQLLTMDMQKIMQDISSVMEQVHGMIGDINRTRREIISRFPTA